MTDRSREFDLFLRLAELRDGSAASAFERTLDLVRLMFRSARIGIWRYDGASGRLEWDATLHEIYGVAPEDFDGRMESWERLVLVEDLPATRAALEAFLAVDQPEPVTFRVRRPSGEIRWLQGWAVAERDAAGELVSILGLNRDVTEEKRLETSMMQATRMEAVGALTTGLASDFNNLLGAALGAAELLADTPPDAPEAATHLAEVREAVERATKVTDDLQAFARRAPLAPGPLDLNAALREMEAMLRRLLPARVALETVTGGALPPALVDRGSLENALLNLVLNARDAMQTGGTLTLETGEIRLDGEAAVRFEEPLSPGRYVTLTVSDTGRGMSPEERARAFEPFWTATPGNSGLGLSTVHGFARQSGGGVSLRSEPGFGTDVKLFLRAAPEAGTPRLSIARAGGAKQVLVAEDDASMRRVLTAQLAADGYEVLWAVDGEAALAAFEAEPRVAAVLVDLTLSGAMQGPELADRLRALRPETPVIFVTGRPEAATALGLAAGERLLRKPAPREALLEAVRKATG
ncbi:MAG TPA: ATP-binding protein [Paracoccaceae bacterium]|nr:ATP-binding protein [Paracoccaceae bacterium]